nr:unnamed protein product [Callosobruchus analis]
MWDILLTATLLVSLNACEIILKKDNGISSDCFENVLDHLFKNDTVVLVRTRGVDVSFRRGVHEVFDHLSLARVQNLVVVGQNMSLSDSLVEYLGRAEKLLLISFNSTSDTVRIDTIVLELWTRHRMLFSLATINYGGVELLTNFDLKTEQICPNFYYKRYIDYCSAKPKVRKITISVEELCLLKVGYIQDYPFVEDVRRKKDPGIWISLLNTYAELRKIHITYTSNRNYIEELLNLGTINQIKADLRKGVIDVGVGYLFMGSEDITYGPVIYKDVWEFVCRPFRKFDNLTKLIIVFGKDLWIAVLSTFLVVVLIYYIIGRLFQERRHRLATIICDMFYVSTGGVVSRLPKLYVLRLIMFLYVALSLNIYTSYFAKLSSIFFNAPTDFNEDLWNAGGVRVNLSHYIKQSTGIVAYLEQKDAMKREYTATEGSFVVNETQTMLLERVAYGQKNATILFQFFLNMKPIEKRLVFHQTKDIFPVSLFCTFFVSKSTPLGPSLQYWSQEIFEKGFVVKWIRDLTPRINASVVGDREKAAPLKVEDYDMLGLLLGAGYMAGLIVLVLEIAIRILQHHETNLLLHIMLFALVGILLLTSRAGCNIALRYEDKGILHCVQNIVHHLFGNESVIVVDDGNNLDFKSEFNAKLVRSHYGNLLEGHNYIVVDSSGTVKNVFERLIENPGSDNKVLVINQEDATTNYGKIMAKLWWRKKSKLATARIHNGKVELFTNFHTKPENVCPNFDFEKYDDYCSSGNAVTMQVNTKKYCTLDAAYVVDFPFVVNIHRDLNPGILVSLMRTYQQIRRVGINYIDSEVYQDEFLNNGTIHNLTKDMTENKIQVAIGHLFMNRTDMNPFHYGPLIFQDFIEFVWRKFLPLGGFQKMTRVFKPDVWYSFGVTFFIVAIIYVLTSLFVKEQVEVTVSLTDLFGVAVGTGLSRLPSSTSLRIIAVFYLIYCLTIDSAYLGMLSSILTKPLPDKAENIWLNGVRCHIPHYVGRTTNLFYLLFITASMRPEFTKAYGTGYTNETQRLLLERLAATQKNSTLLFHSLMRTMPTEASMVEHGIFYQLHSTLFCTYFIGRFTALKNSLQFWSQQMVEMGFVTKWTRDVTEPRRMTENDKEPIAKPLKLEHFEILFKALLYGYLLATLLLICEVVYKKLDTKVNLTENIRVHQILKLIKSFLTPPTT